jgi:hypothetical protein
MKLYLALLFVALVSGQRFGQAYLSSTTGSDQWDTTTLSGLSSVSSNPSSSSSPSTWHTSEFASQVPSSNPEAGAPRPWGLDNLEDFYNALYASYGLNQTAIGNCYNEVSAGGQFNFWSINYALAQAFVSGDRLSVGYYAAQLQAINLTIYNSQQCYLNSSDFQNLLQKFHVRFDNQTILNFVMALYGQAHVNDYAVFWTPINNLIVQGEYSFAGAAFAPIDNQIYANASFDNFWYNGYKAWLNGVFFQMNLTSPYQLGSCFNNITAANGVQFYYLWSQAVANGTAAQADANTQAFFNSSVAMNLRLQLVPIFNCFEQTGDQQRLNNAYGEDIYSQAFDQFARTYIQQNPTTYWTLFSGMYQAFQQHNGIGAGAFMSAFWQQVSQSIRMNSEQ